MRIIWLIKGSMKHYYIKSSNGKRNKQNPKVFREQRPKYRAKEVVGKEIGDIE